MRVKLNEQAPMRGKDGLEAMIATSSQTFITKDSTCDRKYVIEWMLLFPKGNFWAFRKIPLDNFVPTIILHPCCPSLLPGNSVISARQHMKPHLNTFAFISHCIYLRTSEWHCRILRYGTSDFSVISVMTIAHAEGTCSGKSSVTTVELAWKVTAKTLHG